MTLRSYSVHRETGQKWFPRIPDHWSSPPLYLRYQIELGKMLDTQRIKGESLLLYLRNTDVQWDRINVDELPTMDISPNEYARYTLRYGDLLVCEGGEVGRAAMWTDQLPLCAYQKALHRVRPLCANELPRFLYYTMSFAASTGMFIAQGNPNTIPHLTGEALRLYRLPCPPAAEQAAIVAFLDRETAKIDALVAEQERLISLLREKRQAVISHAVTKGLNPDAPRKASGVEWLGEVPAHWKMQRLTEISTFIPGKAHEPFLDDDGPFVYVSSRFVSTGGVSRRFCLQNLTPACFGDSLLVMSDLPNGRALAKCFFVADDLPYAVNQRVCILRPLDVVPKYLAYLVDRNPEFLQHNDGMNQTHLSNGDILKPRFPMPPKDEQLRAVEFLDAQLSTIDELVEHANALTQVILERRFALISAAVTGQIDVRHLTAADAA